MTQNSTTYRAAIETSPSRWKVLATCQASSSTKAFEIFMGYTVDPRFVNDPDWKEWVEQCHPIKWDEEEKPAKYRIIHTTCPRPFVADRWSMDRQKAGSGKWENVIPTTGGTIKDIERDAKTWLSMGHDEFITIPVIERVRK